METAGDIIKFKKLNELEYLHKSENFLFPNFHENTEILFTRA